MRIGIITFHFALNYGAVLQAYALLKCLESMGHEAYIIDYRPTYHTRRYGWKWTWKGLCWTNFVFPVLRRRFDGFVSEHMRLSTRLYQSFEELAADPPDADAYICGSDQIWNPTLTGFDPAYFLAFAPKGTRRIAYAASFGSKIEVTEERCRQLRPCLENIDVLSVREASAAGIIRDMCGRKAEHVLDPTLLVDSYDSTMAPHTIKNRYVLVIDQQNNPMLSRTANLVGRELGLPKIVVNNYSPRVWRIPGKWVFPGPDGYLSLFQHAAYVVTNSFHGTVFSLLYNKPFISTALDNYMVGWSTRITEILEWVGLSDHFAVEFSVKHIRDLLAAEIGWVAVCKRLQELRKGSIAYLQDSLTLPSERYHV